MNKAVIFFLFLLLAACNVSDEKQLLGKWQSDDEWYEYLSDKTYNSGRAYITMVKGYKYNVDIQKKELTMYTDDANQTYYLQYQFKGDDTLLLNNVLNSKPHFAVFYRVKK